MKAMNKVLSLAGAAMTVVIPIIVGILYACPAQSQVITRTADTPKWETVSMPGMGIEPTRPLRGSGF